jgi:hypothetical protein
MARRHSRGLARSSLARSCLLVAARMDRSRDRLPVPIARRGPRDTAVRHLARDLPGDRRCPAMGGDQDPVKAVVADMARRSRLASIARNGLGCRAGRVRRTAIGRRWSLARNPGSACRVVTFLGTEPAASGSRGSTVETPAAAPESTESKCGSRRGRCRSPGMVLPAGSRTRLGGTATSAMPICSPEQIAHDPRRMRRSATATLDWRRSTGVATRPAVIPQHPVRPAATRHRVFVVLDAPCDSAGGPPPCGFSGHSTAGPLPALRRPWTSRRAGGGRGPSGVERAAPGAALAICRDCGPATRPPAGPPAAPAASRPAPARAPRG